MEILGGHENLTKLCFPWLDGGDADGGYDYDYDDSHGAHSDSHGAHSELDAASAVLLQAKTSAWVNRSKDRQALQNEEGGEGLLQERLAKLEPARAVDAVKLATLVKRQKVYGDLLQSFNEKEITDALLLAQNDVPLALEHHSPCSGH